MPRLLTSEAQAKRVIHAWSIYPNASTIRFESWVGEGEDVRTKPDGRSKTDLVIVKVKFVETTVTPTLTKEEFQLLQSGRRIHAIKAYKERTRLGLKESVDAIRAAEPTVHV